MKQWEQEVGEGYSGPVAVGHRIWIHARKGRREIVKCLRLVDGSEVWNEGYDADFEQDPSARAHGRGPYSTPSVIEGRLFTLGITSILSAWNADSGTLLWRTDCSSEFDPSFPLFGAAASPLVRDDLCYVHFGASEGQKPGNPGRGAMMALRVDFTGIPVRLCACRLPCALGFSAGAGRSSWGSEGRRWHPVQPPP